MCGGGAPRWRTWWKGTKLLPAPRPAAVGKVRVWILLGVLVVALVFAGWRWRRGLGLDGMSDSERQWQQGQAWREQISNHEGTGKTGVLTGFPASRWTIRPRQGITPCSNRRVGRYPGWWSNFRRLPGRRFRASSGGVPEAESGLIRPLTVAGAAQVRSVPKGRFPPASR